MNWNTLLQAAITAQILPPEARDKPAPTPPHPWPLVLMSFLGALFAALPLLGFLGLMLGSTLMKQGPASYLVGAALAAGCCQALRSKRLPLFAESLALTFMLTGLGLLFYALVRDLSAYGYPLCALCALGLALLVPVRWVQSLLAALAGGASFGALLDSYFHAPLIYFSLAHAGVWLAGLWLQQRLLAQPARAHYALSLEWLASGWITAVLVATVWLPEMRFMFNWRFENQYWVVAALGVASSLAASVWLVRRWPRLRSLEGIGLLLVLAALSGFMPLLGVVVAIGLVALGTQRHVQASAAALAGVWIIGRFYYVLQWSLVSKAQVLALAGIILVALAWWSRPRGADGAAQAVQPPGRRGITLASLGALATLLVVNIGIWQKEGIIAYGQPVFIKLAPVDPRSLMQGDYMALNFDMPPGLRAKLNDLTRLERPRVIGRIDSRGVLTLQRLAERDALRNSEALVELSPGKRGWVVVTDAWFFREGDGARWAKARYGEFRLMPDGKALLVGMADDALQPIRP